MAHTIYAPRVSVAPLVPWLLRLGFAACFIGHGAFGLLQKRDWQLFFSQFGIGEPTALMVMPLVGSVDIALGIAALWGAPRAVILYGAIWCVFTAALRPMAALSAGEFFERAGNYGVPIAILAFTAGQGWLTQVRTGTFVSDRAQPALTACLWATVLLLFGHGWLALENKPLLASHLSLVGAAAWLPAFGVFEIALAIACAVRPSHGLLIGVALWKIATESLFLFAGAPVWEFIERGGSYVAPLAAAALIGSRVPVHSAKMARLSTAALTAIAVAAGAAITGAQSPALTPALLAELQQGGLVVACRHAITSHEVEDRMPVDFNDPSTQRVLSPAGDQQAMDLGKSFGALKLRFGAVLASPFQRTRRSAELMAGDVQIAEALSSMARGRDAELRALLAGPVEPGSNRLIVTHQGLLYRVFRSVKQGSIREGDCLVVRPNEQGGDVIAVVTAADWAAAARHER
jgi:phosphohistidine phosphatase SixA